MILSRFPELRRRAASLVLTVLAALVLASALRAQTPLNPADFNRPIKLACVGDSITAGHGADPGKGYPDQLQALLGPKWQVHNYGEGGRTLLKQGDYPWWNEASNKNSHDLQPDAVVIMLGTNDTKPQNWVHRDQFVANYKELIESFKVLPSKPQIWIMRPPPTLLNDPSSINEPNLQILLGEIDQLAKDENVGEIDIHAVVPKTPEMIPDNIHPGNAGAGLIAKAVAQAISK